MTEAMCHNLVLETVGVKCFFFFFCDGVVLCRVILSLPHCRFNRPEDNTVTTALFFFKQNTPHCDLKDK